MGATAGYCRPVNPTGISTWRAHTNRGTPSVEPGTDFYCPRGTPIRAAASGRIVDVGDSINPATGRYVTIDLDDGRRVRYLHLERRHVNVGDRVQWGQHIADSGATGYGEADWSWNVAETGGAHVHMTLWAHQEYTFGRYATLDPEVYMASDQGGNGTTLTEDGNMQSIQINGKIYGINNEFITHYGNVEQAQITTNVYSASDEIHQLDLNGFVNLLDGSGIPRGVLDANGHVLNPQSGTFEDNGTWSRQREILAALAKR